MKGDAVYFTQRAEQERAAALQTPHPQARRAHLEMAARYEQFAAAFASGETLIKLASPPPDPPGR